VVANLRAVLPQRRAEFQQFILYYFARAAEQSCSANSAGTFLRNGLAKNNCPLYGALINTRRDGVTDTAAEPPLPFTLTKERLFGTK